MTEPDPTRCPLCGQPNRCAVACGADGSCAGATGPCWCAQVSIPAALLDQLPAAAKGKACVCAECVARATTAPPRRRS